MSFRLSYANVVATLCLVALAGTAAVSAIAQSGPGSKKLAACYVKRGEAKGAMRYLPKATARCKQGEKKVTWNQTGPQGPQGLQGAQGVQGAPGETGPPGTDATAAAPTGAVMFFNRASCPAGWTAFAGARGRYIVGLNPAGTLGATVGNALSNTQNRAVGAHTHTVSDPGHSHGINGSGASVQVPNAIVSFNGRGSISTLPAAPNGTTSGIMSAPSGITVNSTGGSSGTNAPYVQLLACEKD